MIKLKTLLEAKLDITAHNKVTPEEMQQAAKLLYKYFEDRGTLNWMFSFSWELEEVKESYIDGLRFRFNYWPKKGRTVERPPYPDAEYTKLTKAFKTPESAMKYAEADAKAQFGDKFVFRGMNMKEWIAAQKQGFIKSNAEYNLGQVPLTYYGAKFSTAHSYAGGFAPFDKEPTRDTPGVVVAVPRELTLPAKDATGYGMEDEYVAEKVPLDQVQGVWYIVPIQMGKGYFELVFKNDKLDRGSASPPSARFVIVPKAGVALS